MVKRPEVPVNARIFASNTPNAVLVIHATPANAAIIAVVVSVFSSNVKLNAIFVISNAKQNVAVR